MKLFMTILLAIVLFGCSNNCRCPASNDDEVRACAATSVSLSDFSMKIVGHYRSVNQPVPENFGKSQFFSILEKVYPDQAPVNSIRENYQVYARSLDGGYSVMLCDPATNQKLMEDLSCHLNRVEIRSWENQIAGQCVFENNWKPYCE
jgi:hypothetical protein